MKISIVAGARPNFIKIAPLARAIERARNEGKDISYRLVYTGTRHDRNIDASLFSDLDMPQPDSYLEVAGSNLAEQAGAIMVAFTKELQQHPADVVIVVDDLTPTMACAIAAKKEKAKVAHLVAGTRSFDMDMPKEINRMIADGLSDYLFTAGMVANRNLNQAGTESQHIYFVGNILIDGLRYNRNRLQRPPCYDALGLKEKQYILLTLNKQSLTNDRTTLTQLLKAITHKAQGMPVIVPAHEQASRGIAEADIQADNLHIIPPQGYLAFGYLENNAKAIITDSGNLAEEATFLGIPCITLDTYTEHPETVTTGTNELVGTDPEKLEEALDRLFNGEWKKSALPERWDGRTADRIVKILSDDFE